MCPGHVIPASIVSVAAKSRILKVKLYYHILCIIQPILGSVYLINVLQSTVVVNNIFANRQVIRQRNHSENIGKLSVYFGELWEPYRISLGKSDVIIQLNIMPSEIGINMFLY